MIKEINEILKYHQGKRNYQKADSEKNKIQHLEIKIAIIKL